jgi:hypothetical protein
LENRGFGGFDAWQTFGPCVVRVENCFWAVKNRVEKRVENRVEFVWQTFVIDLTPKVCHAKSTPFFTASIGGPNKVCHAPNKVCHAPNKVCHAPNKVCHAQIP